MVQFTVTKINSKFFRSYCQKHFGDKCKRFDKNDINIKSVVNTGQEESYLYYLTLFQFYQFLILTHQRASSDIIEDSKMCNFGPQGKTIYPILADAQFHNTL